MKTRNLYLYHGDGGTIQTPIKIEGAAYTPMYRLVADEGKRVTDGTTQTSVIDIPVEDLSKWTEIDAPKL